MTDPDGRLRNMKNLIELLDHKVMFDICRLFKNFSLKQYIVKLLKFYEKHPKY